MADNKKTYSIVINGIQESVKAVDSLNDALGMLEQKIKNLEQSKISVSNTTSSSSSSSRESSLQQEDKLLKQIQSTEQQIKDARREDYQQLLAQKDILKDITNEQKKRAASERLVANNYGNTMQGMKQQLADIKSVMQTTDIDSDKFQELTRKANELNTKLKEVEATYGQFGRNVGNYSGDEVAQGMQKITVAVGNTTREFASSKEAARKLKEELVALEVSGERDTEKAKELRKAYHELKSAMDDATVSSKAMDEAMDFLTSFTSLASISQGLSAFFGFDDDEIQRSIQRLVALQNVLKGIETLRKQMQTGEGIGKILSYGNDAIDKFVVGITGAKKGVEGLTTASRAGTIAVRGLSIALKGIGIGLAIAAINVLMKVFESASSEMDNASKHAERFGESMNTLKKIYQTRLDQLGGRYMNKAISDEEYLSKTYKEECEYISQLNKLIRERQSLINQGTTENDIRTYRGTTDWGNSAYGSGFTGNKFSGKQTITSFNWSMPVSPTIEEVVTSIEQVESEFNKCQEAIAEGKDYFDKWGSGLNAWLGSLFTTVGDTERVMRGLGNIRLSDFVGSFSEVNEQFKNGEITAEEYAAKLKELVDTMNSNKVLQSVIANLDKYIPDENVRQAVNNIISEIVRLNDAFNMTSAEQIHHWNQVRIDGMKQGAAKIKAQIAEEERYEIQKEGKTQEQINLIKAKYDRKRTEQLDAYNKQVAQKNKERQKKEAEAEKELSNLKIANMREGLEKQIAQINAERDDRIRKAEETGIKVGEITLEINKLYDKKVLEAKRDWSYNMLKTYQDLASNIDSVTRQIYNSEYNSTKTNIGINRDNAVSTSAKESPLSDFNGSDIDKNIQLYQDYYNKLQETQEKYNARFDELEEERLKAERDDNIKDEKLRHEREVSVETSNKVIAELEAYAASHNGADMLAQGTEAEFNELEAKMQESLSNMRGTLVDSYNRGEIDFKQFCELVEMENAAHSNSMLQIERSYQSQSNHIQSEALKKKQTETNDYYSSMVSVIRTQEEKISQLTQKSPKMSKLGFINIAATKKEYDQAVQQYQALIQRILQLKQQLKQDLNGNKITASDFLLRQQELDQALHAAENSLEETTNKQKKLIQDFIGSVSDIVSNIGNSLNSIVGAIGDYTDQEFENQIKALEDHIDEYEDLLDKQKQITEEHASEVNSVEEELKDARGSRREALIDKLNAEMDKQRQSLAEEKRIEKEKERLEHEKEEKEKERLDAQKKIQRTQAIIAGAVAFMNALATQPFWVGLAMATMTAAMTAVQIATIESQKYAQGGVIEGKSHAQGGVKVLGGRAEVEGGEYITNKTTTAKNVDLLEYINSKRRKVNLDDMLEFYSSGKSIKKNINLSRTKFANGGQIPQLRNDIDINDRLLTAFEDYSNRPQYVAVVDIMDRMDSVNKIQVMAGLQDD